MRKLILCLLIAALAVPLVACGNDDDDDTKAAAPTTAKSSTAEYCAVALDLDTAPGPEIDFEKLTPEQQKTETKKYVNETIAPKVDRIEKLVPAEIKAEATTLIGAIRQVQQTGDFEAAFENNPAVEAADKRVHAYELGACGYRRQDVTATEYAFAGAPASVTNGVTSFELANKGKEEHEISILRINDGVTESAADLMKLSQEEGEKKAKFIAGGDSAKPGDSSYTVTKFTEPGRYLMACFLPVGGKEGQPTHASKGMFAEFKVS